MPENILDETGDGKRGFSTELNESIVAVFVDCWYNTDSISGFCREDYKLPQDSGDPIKKENP